MRLIWLTSIYGLDVSSKNNHLNPIYHKQSGICFSINVTIDFLASIFGPQTNKLKKIQNIILYVFLEIIINACKWTWIHYQVMFIGAWQHGWKRVQHNTKYDFQTLCNASNYHSCKKKVSLVYIKNGEKLQTSFWGTSKCHIWHDMPLFINRILDNILNLNISIFLLFENL